MIVFKKEKTIYWVSFQAYWAAMNMVDFCWGSWFIASAFVPLLLYSHLEEEHIWN